MGYLLSMCAVLCFWAGNAVGEEKYHWPMQAEPALTSSFAEYRSGRLHAAIDLKTWGKEGYPVMSVDEGYVWRVRTSPWGYGRAVYVRLKDGRTGVWAHLSGFSERIQKYVVEEQDRRGQYSINMYFRSDQLPVTRGEVIGFSGSTGIGVPHLHFELRDENNWPLNPLTHGLNVEDTLAPTMLAVGLVPQDGDARINGKPEPVVRKLRWQAQEKRYICPDTLQLWGRIGVALEVFDRVDASALWNKIAPYRLQLQVDNQTVFGLTYEKFGYGETHHGELDRNFLLHRHGLGRFHNLYREPGNQLPFYGEYVPGDGILRAGLSEADSALSVGVHTLVMVAEDARGNRAEAEVVVQVVPPPVISALQVLWREEAVMASAQVYNAAYALFSHSADSGKTWQPVDVFLPVGEDGIIQRELLYKPGIYRLQIENATGASAFRTFSPAQGVSFTSAVDYFPKFGVVRILTDRVAGPGPRVLAFYSTGQKVVVPVRQTDLKTFEAIVPFDEEADDNIEVWVQSNHAVQQLVLTQQTVTATQGGEVALDNGSVRARFTPGSVYKTLFGHVEVDTLASDNRLVGTAFRFMPDDVAFEQARLEFAYPDDFNQPEKLGLYTLSGKGRWVFVDNGRDDEQKVVTGEVKSFGTFAVMVDNVAPEILDVRPENGSETTDRRPFVTATVRDTTSGIWREEDLVITVNGETLIVEYDPEEDQIAARPRRPLQPGTHRLAVQVRDICGNIAQWMGTLVVK